MFNKNFIEHLIFSLFYRWVFFFLSFSWEERHSAINIKHQND